MFAVRTTVSLTMNHRAATLVMAPADFPILRIASPGLCVSWSFYILRAQGSILTSTQGEKPSP